MSNFNSGQAVILTNPRGPQKAGFVVGEIDLGKGRGRGKFLLIEVEGQTLKARAGRISAA